MTYVKSQDPRTVYLATTTTSGRTADGEIIDIAILDDAGDILLDSHIRPAWGPHLKKSDAPEMETLRETIRRTLAGQSVVIYGAPSNPPSGIRHLLAPAAEVRCAMLEFAKAAGTWSPKYQLWYPKSLVAAARHVRVSLPTPPRRSALHTCRATRAIWRYATDSAERARVDALRADAQSSPTSAPDSIRSAATSRDDTVTST